MDVELAVKRLVRRYKTNCPFTLAKSLNIELRREYLGKATRGIYYRKLRHRYIVVHEDLPDEASRLVVAHELGHDRLHKGVGYYFVEQNTLFNPGRFERQANRFAVLLLTYGDEIGPGETAELVCVRNGVPAEMAKYLF
ncbi:MAG TPA: ImmA/IrrE family metallo-endopeptidase [Alicyclobacillus sp.]|nr:ImmA/IrrE family metallo-endopeptidase [Alicyclobacillus sp.]